MSEVPAKHTFSFDPAVARAAAEHYRKNQTQRRKKLKAVEAGKIDLAETKERMAKRVNHLVDKMKRQGPALEASEHIPATLAELIKSPPLTPEQVNNHLFERVLGESREFLGVEFLDLAQQATRPVGRIKTRLGNGRVGLGTGFMVSPNLLLTNHHVLSTALEANRSEVEFDFQRGRDGRLLQVRTFSFNPDRFFLADKQLDFALVAVGGTDSTPQNDFLPLIGTEGKISIGERINIIQHPRGRLKEVVIRDNPLLDLPETPPAVAHYKADTEPGSSGSPVFNDEWEVIALHHSGVPDTNDAGEILDIHGNVWTDDEHPELIRWVANEGIRISHLVRFVEGADLGSAQRTLRDELLQPTRDAGRREASGRRRTGLPVKWQPRSVPAESRPRTTGALVNIHQQPGSISMTVPLNITISLGPVTSPIASDLTVGPDFDEAATASELNTRVGYDPNFLGFEAPMPQPTTTVKHLAFVEPETESIELKYTNYTVILHRDRRLAFVSAGNNNIHAPFRHSGSASFKQDPRVPNSLEADNDFYVDNPLDRGHLFRRAAGAWGATQAAAKQASSETYYYPNIAPQHLAFNQSGKGGLWGQLENHIAGEAQSESQSFSVFNGPIFRSDDRLHRGLQIPSRFWKVVIYKNESNQPRAAGFVLSQQEKITDLPSEEFEFDDFEIHQRRISEIADLAALDFGLVSNLDVLDDAQGVERVLEAAGGVPLTINDFADVIV